jgi:hypothetical protein
MDLVKLKKYAILAGAIVVVGILVSSCVKSEHTERVQMEMFEKNVTNPEVPRYERPDNWRTEVWREQERKGQ